MKNSALEKTSINFASKTQLEKKPSDFWLTVRNNVRLKHQSPAIKPVSRNQNLPLSFNQERLWFLEQLQPGTSVHNILHCLRLKGLVNVVALEQSLLEIARRHESLRTTFGSVDGQPIQIISPEIAWKLPIVDLTQLPPDEREQQAQKLALDDAEQPFNLAKGPLWRIKLLRLGEQEHILFRTIHHIIFDGWSQSVFMRELGGLYDAFCAGQPSPLSELPVQYADYAQTQRQWLQGDVFSAQMDYWQQHLSGDVSALELPTDYPRPLVPSYRGAYQPFELSETLTEALKKFSYQEGVSLFVSLLSAFKTLLHRYTEQEDILVCSPVAGRHRVETKGLIGYFNNVVAMRTDLSGDPTFRELLGRVSQVSADTFAHQDMPLQKVAELPNLVRTPLTRAMFVLQNTPNQSLELDGLTVSSLYVDREIANFDLSLSLQEKAGKLTGGIQYKTDLFKATSIAQMLEHFQVLLESLVTNPAQCLTDLPRLREQAHQLSDDHETSVRSQPEQQAMFMAPRDELERKLTQIWEDVLGIRSIGVQDNFFALGGYSLLAVRLSEQIEATFNRNLPLATIFQAPTVEQLASILRQKEWSPSWSSLTAIQPNGSKPPLFLCEGVGIYYPLVPYLGPDQPIYGLVTGSGSGEAFQYERLEELAAHYIEEIRTLQPEGPYFLGGLSWGGIAAFEVAQQLIAQGQEVALLAFLDTIRPGSYIPKPFTERVAHHWSEFLQRGHAYVAEKVNERHEKIQEKLKQYWLQRKLSKLDSQPALEDKQAIPATLQHFAMRQAFAQACENYVPQVYPGRVTIFAATDRTDVGSYNVEPGLGWSVLTSEGIEIHDVPGDHLSLLKEPHVQILGEKLKACLDQV